MQRLKVTYLLLSCCMSDAMATEYSVMVIRADGVRVHFTAELAATIEDRRRGLMHRRELASRHGMWFDFEHDSPVVMWMKNTFVALDMLFVTAAGTVAGSHAYAVPHSLDRIAAPRPVRYVFELNAGEVHYYAIEAGDQALLMRR